jgi:hypothetical protein
MRKIVKSDICEAKEKEMMTKMLLELNKCFDYVAEEKCVKVVVLMNATGSMENLLNNAKDTIKLYFEKVC